MGFELLYRLGDFSYLTGQLIVSGNSQIHRLEDFLTYASTENKSPTVPTSSKVSSKYKQIHQRQHWCSNSQARTSLWLFPSRLLGIVLTSLDVVLPHHFHFVQIVINFPGYEVHFLEELLFMILEFSHHGRELTTTLYSSAAEAQQEQQMMKTATRKMSMDSTVRVSAGASNLDFEPRNCFCAVKSIQARCCFCPHCTKLEDCEVR